MTTAFKDRTGTEWPVEVTVGSLRRVREATGLKLGELMTDRTQLERLYQDDELAGQVLFELCRSVCKGMTQHEFIELLHGQALREGRDAIVEAAANFTLPPAIFDVFSRTWRSDRQTRIDQLAEMMTSPSTATESSESAGNSPESSVLIPAL
jgi:hypothetical protein